MSLVSMCGSFSFQFLIVLVLVIPSVFWHLISCFCLFCNVSLFFTHSMTVDNLEC